MTATVAESAGARSLRAMAPKSKRKRAEENPPRRINTKRAEENPPIAAAQKGTEATPGRPSASAAKPIEPKRSDATSKAKAKAKAGAQHDDSDESDAKSTLKASDSSSDESSSEEPGKPSDKGKRGNNVTADDSTDDGGDDGDDEEGEEEEEDEAEGEGEQGSGDESGDVNDGGDKVKCSECFDPILPGQARASRKRAHKVCVDAVRSALHALRKFPKKMEKFKACKKEDPTAWARAVKRLRKDPNGKNKSRRSALQLQAVNDMIDQVCRVKQMTRDTGQVLRPKGRFIQHLLNTEYKMTPEKALKIWTDRKKDGYSEVVDGVFQVSLPKDTELNAKDGVEMRNGKNIKSGDDRRAVLADLAGDLKGFSSSGSNAIMDIVGSKRERELSGEESRKTARKKSRSRHAKHKKRERSRSRKQKRKRKVSYSDSEATTTVKYPSPEPISSDSGLPDDDQDGSSSSSSPEVKKDARREKDARKEKDVRQDRRRKGLRDVGVTYMLNLIVLELIRRFFLLLFIS